MEASGQKVLFSFSVVHLLVSGSENRELLHLVSALVSAEALFKHIQTFYFVNVHQTRVFQMFMWVKQLRGCLQQCVKKIWIHPTRTHFRLQGVSVAALTRQQR